MTSYTLQLTILVACFVLAASQDSVDASLFKLFPLGSPLAQEKQQRASLLQIPSTTLSATQNATLNPENVSVSSTPISLEHALVSTQVTTVITFWNAVMLCAMSALVFKVWSAPSEPGATVSSDSEDMSISKALPSVLLWCSLGVILICYNKYLYLPKDAGGFGFPCPMALTWWHMFTGLVATNIVRLIRPDWMPAVQEGKLDFRGFMRSVVPIGVVFGVYLAIGNSAYLYLSVSFVQMLKSAGPMFVFSISCAFGLERMTAAAVLAIAIVVMGVAGASVGEMAFSWLGFALQFAAFILDGLRMVLLKVLMSSRGTKLDPLSGLYYYSPVCVLTLIPPVLYFEGQALKVVLAQASPSLFVVIALNGFVAFSLNVSLLALFANASATTVSMASVIRDILLTFGTAALFHTSLTRVQVLGYLSACVGVKLWDEIKARPDAFYKAFGMWSPEQLPLCESK